MIDNVVDFFKSYFKLFLPCYIPLQRLESKYSTSSLSLNVVVFVFTVQGMVFPSQNKERRKKGERKNKKRKKKKRKGEEGKKERRKTLKQKGKGKKKGIIFCLVVHFNTKRCHSHIPTLWFKVLNNECLRDIYWTWKAL